MCKSMNALFLSFHGQRTRKQLLDKLSRSSNKNEGGHLMYSKNGIPWVRPLYWYSKFVTPCSNNIL